MPCPSKGPRILHSYVRVAAGSASLGGFDYGVLRPCTGNRGHHPEPAEGVEGLSRVILLDFCVWGGACSYNLFTGGLAQEHRATQREFRHTSILRCSYFAEASLGHLCRPRGGLISFRDVPSVDLGLNTLKDGTPLSTYGQRPDLSRSEQSACLSMVEAATLLSSHGQRTDRSLRSRQLALATQIKSSEPHLGNRNLRPFGCFGVYLQILRT